MLSPSSAIYIVQGVGITLQYTFIAWGVGSVLGTLLALLKYNKIALPLVNGYISFLRGTPLLVQLMAVYFLLPTLLGNVSISVFAAGAIAFSLNSSAYLAEIIRTGFNAVDSGQKEAAQALGIPARLMWKDIIFPQAIKAIFPALMNESITLLKETALISTLGEQDIMRRAQLVSAEHYSYFEPLAIAAISYYVLVLGLEKISKQVEKRWFHDFSTQPL